MTPDEQHALADRLDHRATQNAIVRSYGIMPSSRPDDDDLDRAAAAVLRATASNNHSIAARHQEHYRYCECVGDSSECCDATCPCHTASNNPTNTDTDDFGDPDEDLDALVVAHLPEKLRERTCPAGLPHTGDDPTSDHGHTDCWIMQLAATEIERLRTERDAAAEECQRHQVGQSYQVGYEHGAATAAMFKAERDAAVARADRLRAALDELTVEHRPMWSGVGFAGFTLDEQPGYKPVGCCMCFPADGSWPCATRLIADAADAADAVAPVSPATPTPTTCPTCIYCNAPIKGGIDGCWHDDNGQEVCPGESPTTFHEAHPPTPTTCPTCDSDDPAHEGVARQREPHYSCPDPWHSEATT